MSGEGFVNYLLSTNQFLISFKFFYSKYFSVVRIMDHSNGYEKIAPRFIKHREQDRARIGAVAVREWAKSLAPGSAVLDIGCGSGIPITQTLISEEMKIYAIDASAAMVRRFKENFPDVPVACESVEDSNFFNLKYDGIIAWGLMFLFSEETQERLIKKIAEALKTNGQFIFTAPWQKTEWEDLMTGRSSRSLGKEKYRELLSAAGLSWTEEFEDKAGNYYYSSVKV